MKFIGHQKIWQFLENLAKTDRLSHAYLFLGQEKLGKKTLAVEFLKLFFGPGIFQHPDFVFVAPKGDEIQISQIRDLNWKLSLKSISTPLKAAIIDNAHLMNQEAQNCFLKTIEEPKGKAILILITNHPEFLLPTIISRVQKIKFNPTNQEEIENYLKEKGASPEKIKVISEISMGRPGVAIDFLSDLEKLKDYKERKDKLTGILNSDLASRFQYAKELSQKEDLGEVLDIWSAFFRKALFSKLNLEKDKSLLGKEYSLEKLKNNLLFLQNTKILISTTNVNPRLALEVLLMEF